MECDYPNKTGNDCQNMAQYWNTHLEEAIRDSDGGKQHSNGKNKTQET